jgi:UDP-glucose 4-epimerase
MGGAIGRFAAAHGHEVLGISRATQPSSDWPGGYVAADVVTADLSRTLRDFAPDAILHAAGSASVGNSFVAPLEDLRAAVLAWANVLEAIRRSTMRPLIVFPSSAAVYGNPKLPIREDAPLDPISPYGFHKAACELIAREYADCFGARIMICRLFSLFGEAQRRLFVWEVYRQIISNDPMATLQGTGEETRDYLHIADAASAILLLMQREIASGNSASYQVVNLASGVETKVLDLANQVRSLLESEKPIECRSEKRPGDPPHWVADIGRLRTMIPDWQPQPLAERLSECIKAWLM